MEKELYHLWLYEFSGLTMKKIIELLNYYDTPQRIYEADMGEIRFFMSDEQAVKFERSRDLSDVEGYIELLEKKGVGYITILDENYPELLKEIYDPPGVLYYIGNIELLREELKLGIVGARAMSVYGREMAGIYSKELAASGIVVVSGLASGVDVTSHRGAMSVPGGKTIGVLGSGIDVCYPKENYMVYEKMCNEQLVISEHGLGVKPLAYNFPLRNRIISGLCQGILVVEARKKSGSLITADSCLEQGRNVYALPGRVTDELSEGTNNLIKMGATMTMSPSDIISDYRDILKQKIDSIKNESVTETKTNNMAYSDLNDDEKKILDILSLDPMYIDEIVGMLQMSVSSTIHMVYGLVAKGYVKEEGNGYFIKKYN